MKWLNDFISLIFPRICVGCGNSLWKHEEVLCTLCRFHLPKTGFHKDPDNPAARVFYGRCMMENVASFLWFNKGNKTQRLVHHLKYKGRKDVGVWIGREYGKELRDAPGFSGVEIILPVPLHKKRFMQRGYNQSEQFAIGLSQVMGLPVSARNMYRTHATQTQTRKGRYSRWENVSGLFALKDPEGLAGKHVLLVDDVITTGATLEACSDALKVVPGIRVSVASIAFTHG